MTITELGLVMREEPLWHDKVQVVLGACHRHIQEPPLFLDFLRRVGCSV